jgi:DNA-binding MarR family transcriptional regulator
MNEKTLLIFPMGLDALMSAPLAKSESVVLWWLAKNMPPAGAVLTQAMIAAGCGTTPFAVARTLKILIQAGYIRRLSKLGTSYHYRLNTTWFAYV